MEQKQYLNFDLLLEGSAGAYLARVLDSPAGQDKFAFESLFPPEQLNPLLERLAQADEQAAVLLGKNLYESIFASGLQSLLNRSLDEAMRQDKGLRIRLRLSDVPELINLPWETLYDPTFQRFFARSVDTPIVRFLDLPERDRPLTANPPLRVLVMISSPGDFPSLNVDAEWQRLKTALAPLEQNGMLSVEWLDQATLPMLQQRLRQNQYHIFHYLGHGVTDEEKKTGALVFESDNGMGSLVNSQQLGTLFYDEKTIRLVVLNACQGGQTWASHPFGGVAQGLVQQGVPAVVAMQFPVSDRAAIAFSHGFYSALADFLPVDAAIGEARKAIYLDGNATEWITPVLYLRSSSAYIFGQPEAQASPQVISATTTALKTEFRSEKVTPPAPATTTPGPAAPEFITPGKWLMKDNMDQDLTVELIPSAPGSNEGAFRASLYFKPARSWIERDLEGEWGLDPVKKRLRLKGEFTDNSEPFEAVLLIGYGQAGFFTAKDNQGGRYKLIRITGEFQPVGKWLFTYEMDGPSELEVEFLPGTDEGGEFNAVEHYKVSKRWVAEDLHGEWVYDAGKKRLALTGNYIESGNRFSLTPYIQRWEGNHFLAKDHDGLEFFLHRVG